MKLRDIPEEQIFQLVERLDVRGPRYTSYPTVPVWQDDFPAAPYLDALRTLEKSADPISIYVHLPFCRSRCLYCGCNSCITSDEQRIISYVDALTMEIERVSEITGVEIRHAQLHLGGGTPTYTPAAELSALLDLLINRFPGADDAERSVEVDPRVTTDEHLRRLAERGFRRISIGLQDLNPAVQQAIHRVYSREQLEEFIARSRHFGFTGINIDLIYGLPLQTRASWKTTLQAIASLKPDRLACFGYAHLPQRMKHQRAIREEDLPSPRDRLGMLLDANRFFTDSGYVAVGMDHFALPDDELSMARQTGRLWRNFMGYTTSRGMELIGFGCSGISEFENLFAQNIVTPEAYTEAIRSGHWPIKRGYRLDMEDRIRKQVINHLMCNLEIAIPEAAQQAENGLLESLSEAMHSLQEFEADGLIMRQNGGYSITELGQLFVRNLAMPFDRYLPSQSGTAFSRTV